VAGQPNLFEVILALATGGSFPNFLNCGEQQADENCDNGYDNEQLNQSEGVAGTMHRQASPDTNESDETQP
jgi:hypothetical protein